MPGHYVGEREAIIDVSVGVHHLTLCAPFAGKIMRSRPLGAVVYAGEILAELTRVGTPTWEVFVAYRQSDAPGTPDASVQISGPTSDRDRCSRTWTRCRLKWITEARPG